MIDTGLCRDVLFEFPLKFLNTSNIGIPVEVYNRVEKKQLVDGIHIKHLGLIIVADLLSWGRYLLQFFSMGL